MKKILSTLALLLALMTAAGCTVEMNEESAQRSEGTSTPSSALSTLLTASPDSTTAISTQVSVTTVTDPPETEQPTPNSDTFIVPRGDGEAAEYTPDADQPQLYEIIDLPSDGIPSVISTWDRFMLIDLYLYNYEDYNDEDFPEEESSTEVMVLDLVTGEVTATYQYDDVVEVGFLENGCVYLVNYEPLSVKVYDRSGALALDYTPEGYDQITVDQTGAGWAWFSRWDGEELERISLSDGASMTYTLPASEGRYFQTAVDGSAYLSVFNENDITDMWLLTADGKCEKMASFGSYYGVGDTLCYESFNNCWRYIDLRAPSDRIYSFEIDERDAYILSANKGRYLVEWYSYDEEDMLDENKLILCTPSASSRTELQLINRYVFGQCWSEDALYLLLSEGEDKTSVCLWDYEDAPSEKLDTSVYTITEQEKENLQYAEQLQSEWGISIYFGEDDMSRVPSDYTAYPLTDQVMIADALDSLAEALADYPEGFFVDLPYGEYDHLEIYLCSGLSPADGYGISNAIALSNTRGSALVIFLDMTSIGDLTETLAHEILHMMERRIDQIDPSLLESWTQFTPGGDDAYYFSYHDENGDEMNDESNTWYGEFDTDLIYFVDAYSKSFPTEDRARIFEFLVGGRGDPFFSDSPILMAKAEHLCEIIRLTFPSVANADSVIWEVA